MEWTSSFTFPIYAVGDGLFMQRVLNSVAALSNSGVLASLGLLGLLLGLLLVAMRGISTGGRQIELPSLFMSLVLYAIMFGGTANVMIQDVGAPAGVYTNASYTVGHVPFGIAAMGWAVSNISYDLSEKLQQAYGLPDATVGDVMSVGFDRSLDWLTAGRYAAMPDIDDVNHHVSRFRHNVVSYLRYCTPKALDVNPDQINTMRHSAEPFDMVTGLGFNSAWDTFPYLDTNSGAQSEVTCADGVPKLMTYRDGPFFSDFTAASAVPMGFSGSSSASAEANASWTQIAGSQQNATQFYANGLINSAMNEALAGVPIAGDMQVANALMVDTADAQRATKFAGEESLFRRMIRPMMAFFESLIYIAAPFMALVLGFGGMGPKMVGRYALATIWVSMWMPTLAAINLYQETMAQEALGPYLNPPPGTTGATFHSISTLFGAAHAYGALDDLIATGSLLAASTPAITAFLLFGSNLALNSLWSGMTGAGDINPKMATPDPVNTPAAIERSALARSTPGGGMETPGAPGTPMMQFSSQEMLSAARAQVGQASTMVSASSSEASKVADSNVMAMSKGGGATLSNSSSATQAQQRMVQVASSAGIDLSGLSSDQLGAVAANAQSTTERVGASLAGNLGLSSPLGGLGINANAGVEGAKSATDTDTKGNSLVGSMSNQVRAAMQKNDGLTAAVTGANVAASEAFARAGFSHSQGVTKSSDFSKLKRDTSMWTDRYQDQQQYSGSSGISQTVSPTSAFNTIAAQEMSSGKAGSKAEVASNLAQEYMKNGGNADNLREATAAFGGKGLAYEHDPATAQGAGALLAMYQQMPGAPSTDAATAKGLKDHLVSKLEASHIASVNTGGAVSQEKPTNAAGDGMEAKSARGDATREAAGARPGVNVKATEGAVAAGAGASPSQMTQMGANFGGGEMASANAQAQGGGGSAASMRSSEPGKAATDVNDSNFNKASAPLEARGTKAMENAQDLGKAKEARTMDATAMADSNVGADAVAAAHSSGWQGKAALLTRDPMRESVPLGKAMNGFSRGDGPSFGGKEAPEDPSRTPRNHAVDASIADAESGRVTGHQMNHEAAVVVGTAMGVLRSQQPASVEQGKAADASYSRLPTDQQRAVNDYINAAVPNATTVSSTLQSSPLVLTPVPTLPSADGPKPQPSEAVEAPTDGKEMKAENDHLKIMEHRSERH